MALEFAHGAQAWNSADAATTVYTISGLTFQPKALMFFITGIASAVNAVNETDSARVCIGFATSTSDRRCQGFLSVDNAGSADTQEIYRADAVLATVSAAAAVDGLLDLNSITSDGFTLIVDDAAPVNLTVFWFAWGGDDIENAATGEITEPAATGVQSYNVTNWLASVLGNNVVMFAGCKLTAAAPTAAVADAGFMFGAASATGAGNQFVDATNEDEGSATMDTDTYIRGDECLAMIVDAGGNPNARVGFNGFDSTGFDLNWTARAVTNRRYIYLAIQGGSWTVGNIVYDSLTVGNTQSVPLTYPPKGALHVNAQTRPEDTAGTSSVTSALGIGCWSSTSSRRAMGHLSRNGAGNAEIQTIIRYDAVQASASGGVGNGIGALIDINAVGSASFEIIVDDAGGSATAFAGFVSFGDAPRPSAIFPDYTARERKIGVSGMRPPNQVN